jgi:signal transduction histidine kinase
MRIWPLSIRWKFILTIIAFTLVLAIPFGLLTVRRLSDNLYDSILSGWKNALKIAGQTILANPLLPEIQDPIPPETQKLLEGYCQKQILNLRRNFPLEKLQQEQSVILYVQVVKLGREFCSSKGTPTSTARSDLLVPPIDGLTPKQRAELLQSGQEVVDLSTSQAQDAELGDYLDLKYALYYVKTRYEVLEGVLSKRQDPTVDYVRVGISLAPAQAQLRREATVIVLIVLGYVLVGILIAFAFSKMILGPVETLAQAVSRFKQDRAARAKVKSGDELEWLAQEFNQMADAIEERRQELERINTELRKANRVKSEFLAVMGHELKTPLHAIRGYSQLLLEGVDGPLTPAQQGDLKNILQAGDHLLELIDNILKFSKIEAGEEKLLFESVRASEVIEDAIKNINSLARSKGLALRVYAEPVSIVCDRTKLRQILINLLSNAVKHTTQGKIEVITETQNDSVRFAVADTGVGIPAEYHEEIFEPFTQVDSSTTRESQGVGLGLAIVKKYVEMHGGRVGVESQPEKGSTFYFTIPLTPNTSTDGRLPKEVIDANLDRRGRPELTPSATKVS